MPNSLACPAIKALPNGIPFAETFRKITPLGTGFGNPENAINEQAIVFGCHPRIALLAGQKVLDTFPMFIRDSVARQHGGPSLVRENRVRSLPQLPNYCPHGLAVPPPRGRTPGSVRPRQRRGASSSRAGRSAPPGRVLAGPAGAGSSPSGVPAPFAFFCPPALGVALPLLRLFLLLLFLPGPCRDSRED